MRPELEEIKYIEDYFLNKLSPEQKKEFEDIYIVQKEDQFQLFLIVILILLVGEVCLIEKK